MKSFTFFNWGNMNKAIKLISFDAFGTLYTPKVPVTTQYHRIASSYGVEKPLSKIEDEFPKVYKYMATTYPNYGKYSNEIRSSDEWWLDLITRLLGIPDFRSNSKSRDICNSMLSNFESKDAYMIYSDVIPTLDFLQKHREQGKIRMIVSSNTDSALVTVLKNLDLVKYFDHIYLSYDLGVGKPTREFYEKILELENFNSGNVRCMHIGDEYVKDYEASKTAGIEGIFLNREGMQRREGEIKDLRELIDIVKK